MGSPPDGIGHTAPKAAVFPSRPAFIRTGGGQYIVRELPNPKREQLNLGCKAEDELIPCPKSGVICQHGHPSVGSQPITGHLRDGTKSRLRNISSYLSHFSESICQA